MTMGDFEVNQCGELREAKATIATLREHLSSSRAVAARALADVRRLDAVLDAVLAERAALRARLARAREEAETAREEWREASIGQHYDVDHDMLRVLAALDDDGAGCATCEDGLGPGKCHECGSDYGDALDEADHA